MKMLALAGNPWRLTLTALLAAGFLVIRLELAEAATREVPGAYATVQAAIDAASLGDTVLITDSRTYREDVTIGKSITLQGAAGQTPIIEALNSEERFEPLGIEGADYFGCVVRAANVVIENIRFDNPSLEADVAGVSCALSILAPNCLVRGCTLTSAPSSEYNSVGAGVLDLDPLFGRVTTGLVLEDCRFENNKYGAATSWYIVPGSLPEVTFRNCFFTASSSAALEMDTGMVVIEACRFEDNPGTAIGVGGGEAVVRNSTFVRNGTGGSDETIDLDLDGRWDETDEAPVPGTIPPSSIELIGCRLYDNGGWGGLDVGPPTIRVHEGTLVLDHSFVVNSQGPHIQMDDGGEALAPAGAWVNHCDLVGANLSPGIVIRNDGGSQQIEMDLRNSIIIDPVGGSVGIQNDLQDPAAKARLVAAYNAFYDFGATPGEYGVTVEANLHFEDYPVQYPYASIDPSQPGSFVLQAGNQLLTAGENGTYMGSNGAQPPAAERFPLSVSSDGTSLTLQWQGTAGSTYEIQRRESLTTGDWTTIDSQAGVAGLNSWVDPDPIQGTRFYQVRVP